MYTWNQRPHSFVALLDNAGTMCDICYAPVDAWQHLTYRIVGAHREGDKCPVCQANLIVGPRKSIKVHAFGREIRSFHGQNCPASGKKLQEAMILARARRGLS